MSYVATFSGSRFYSVYHSALFRSSFVMSKPPSVTTETKLAVAEATLILSVIGLALGTTEQWNPGSSFHRA